MRTGNQAKLQWPRDWTPVKLSKDLWTVEDHTLARYNGKWYLLCNDTDASEQPHPAELSSSVGDSLPTAIIVLEDHLKEHHA